MHRYETSDFEMVLTSGKCTEEINGKQEILV
jgi:hypothetical protein